MNKKVYSAPEAEIEKFTDVAGTITTSDPNGNGFGNTNDASGEGGDLDGHVF